MGTVSFNEYLQGVILSFCRDEKITCTLTTDVIVQLISSLATYKEEGVALSPDVYLCEDISKMQKISASGKIVHIGEGGLDNVAVKLALKRCAPLAIDGWFVVIERNSSSKTIRYGVMWSNVHPASLPGEVTFLTPDINMSIVHLSQISENLVKIKGSQGGSCLVSLSPEISVNIPDEPITRFVKAITKDTAKSARNLLNNLLQKEFQKILKSIHGTLSVVINSKMEIPDEIQDGVILEDPISLSETLCSFLAAKDIDSYCMTMAATSLMKGMLSCDGIVIFNSYGEIVGYNSFYKPKANIDFQNMIMGGARQRTYSGLSSIVPDKLSAVLIKSQDGQVECKSE